MRRYLFPAAWALAIACTPKSTVPMPSGKPVVVDFDSAPALTAPASTDPNIPFYSGATYDPAVPAPETCLGHPVGARLAPPETIVRCFRLWGETSPRLQVERYALSYEGRELVRAVISSPANLAKLDQILAQIGELADPRTLSDERAHEIIAETPAIAWFGYSIHGDEVSGADASLPFAYHLIASSDRQMADILDRVVIVIDPVMNPDGRSRIMSQIEQSSSFVPNMNDTSMHRGRWPWGRGNHYLFDMNRDWLVGAAPETRGRWRELQRFHPQLLIDAHEMDAQETYLFYPQSEPINAHFPATLGNWQKTFAADQARAFDSFGWAYYTREWADGWFPGYSDAWASLSGAIGILYEQASTKGQPLRRASGRVVTYRESVHAQAVSSMTNLRTLAANREAVLRDYLAFKRSLVSPVGARRTFVVRPGRAPDRERLLITTLLRQGVEIYRADADFSARNSESTLGQRRSELALPKGTYLVPLAQPSGALVATMFNFDARMSDTFLAQERAELERKGTSKMYDVSAWNLGQAFALDGYWIDGPKVPMTQLTELPAELVGIVGADGEKAYAWVVDGRDDASVSFAVLGLERGLTMHIANKDFAVAGKSFIRGSVLVRRGDNVSGIAKTVDEVARQTGVAAVAVMTGRSAGDGPDLGAEHFHLLYRPRIAVIANWPIEPSSFGHLWYHLDQRLRAPVTLLDAQSLGEYDLRRYNVIILPPSSDALAAVLAPHAQALGAWVQAGGTLIATGQSAAILASPDLGLANTRLRRDVLPDLPLYEAAAERDLAARHIDIDADALWRPAEPEPTRAKPTPASPEAPTKPDAGPEGAKSEPPSEQAAQAQDEWMRRFAPTGVILRGLVDTDSWLTLGYDQELPVFIEGDSALVTRAPVQVPVRLAPADALRLSGLLWPEARARLATTAYVTVERSGEGQVVLFASPPVHRAQFIGTARLFANAVVYGPSLGASQPLVW